jgi:hypothetical protein
MVTDLFLSVSIVVATWMAASPVSGQTDAHCAAGTSPQFTAGFNTLALGLGPSMGIPLTCAYPDPSGTGDVEQSTSMGLAFWRKSTNTPTFTNGAEHWAVTASGWRTWTGASIDPPSDAQPFVPTQTGTAGSSGTAAPAADVLSPQQIASVMTATIEVGTPSEHFQQAGPALTISDGMGGTVTAVAGQRVPTADAHGQLVFFWHNTTFIAWDADYESVNVINIASPGDGTFVVTYPSYAVTDAVCCPSLGSTVRTYQWDGEAFRGNLPPPAPPQGGRVSVKLTS